MPKITLTTVANNAEEIKVKAEEKNLDDIIALQQYFRDQEELFFDYFLDKKIFEKIRKIKIEPRDTGQDRKEIKSLSNIIDRFDFSALRMTLVAILKDIYTSTYPFAIENARFGINTLDKIRKSRQSQVKAFDDTVTYMNSPLFASDALGYIEEQGIGSTSDLTNIAKGIDKTTSDRIYRELYDGIENLESMDDLGVRIQSVYADATQSRALMIARTETMRAFNKSTILAYEKAEIKQAQMLISNDERTCEICLPLHGLVVPLSEAQNILPIHPQCLIDKQIPVYTSKGWQPIGKIKIGDLVLTHKGRFRKVTHIFHTPKQTPNVTKISIKNYFHQRYSLTLTNNHPVLVDNKWIEASEVKIGNKISMLSNKCFNCGKLIPYYSKYCSSSCNSKVITKKQWASKEHREKISKSISIGMEKAYNEGRRDRFKDTKMANIKNKELISQGKHVWQDPEFIKKNQQKLGRRNYGKNWLEERFGWMLKQLDIKFESQYPIKYGKDKINRDRYYFVDFAIPENKIAIECDGSYWHKNKNRDKIRQNKIESLGWTVLRFTEDEINKDLKKCGLEVKRVLANHNKEYLFGEYEIKKIKRWKVKKSRTLYNLEVKDDESYIAKGFVVHNCRCTWIPAVGKPILVEPSYDDVMSVFNKFPKLDFINRIKAPKNVRVYGSLKAKSPIKEKVDFIPAKTRKQAEKYIVNEIKVLERANYEGLTIDRINEINRELTRLNRKYPTQRLRAIYTGYADTREIAYVSYHPKFYDRAQLVLNKKYFSENATFNKATKEAIKSGWKSALDIQQKLNSTITHEYAHTLFQSGKNVRNISKAHDVLRKDLRKIKIEFGKAKKEIHTAFEQGKLPWDSYKKALNEIDVSTYAQKNIDEFLAESFQMVEYNNKPSVYAKRAVEAFEKFLKAEGVI